LATQSTNYLSVSLAVFPQFGSPKITWQAIFPLGKPPAMPEITMKKNRFA
jgi:hypothetical protein